MESQLERLEFILKEKDLTKADLARLLFATPQTLNNWWKREALPAKAIFPIAEVLNINPEWLATGLGFADLRSYDRNQRKSELPDSRHDSVGIQPVFDSNVAPIESKTTYIPLISWVQAGEWREAVDLFQPGDAEDWFPRPKNSGPHTFALRIQGDSMTSPYPGQRSYSEGSIIYVDPDVPPSSNVRVVAKLNGEVTFKTYIEDAGRRYLKPINPQYPLMNLTDDCEIIGVVVGTYTPE